MRTVYIIFSAVGWTWLVVVACYLWWRTRPSRRLSSTGATEVVRHDAQ